VEVHVLEHHANFFRAHERQRLFWRARCQDLNTVHVEQDLQRNQHGRLIVDEQHLEAAHETRRSLLGKTPDTSRDATPISCREQAPTSRYEIEAARY
jgi:hypothetical protein